MGHAIHDLLDRLQTAYYMDALYDVAHEDSLEKMRRIAATSLDKGLVPHSLLLHAKALTKASDPLALTERMRTMFTNAAKHG